MDATSGMMAATHSTDAGDRGIGRHVATTLTYEQEFPADPTTVMAMLRDPAYVQEKGERTGSHDITVDVAETADGGVVITCTRSMPAKVPSYAAPFVGDTITITETQTWSAPAADGSAQRRRHRRVQLPARLLGHHHAVPGRRRLGRRQRGLIQGQRPVRRRQGRAGRGRDDGEVPRQGDQVGAEWLAR